MSFDLINYMSLLEILVFAIYCGLIASYAHRYVYLRREKRAAQKARRAAFWVGFGLALLSAMSFDLIN
ncbi:MAG TPA: hypothetical protein VNV36_06105 [Pseudomonas sp.]|uniref:hypothetical protein n=1 Tax=Pseudomonas sp. TaxID=306 RepID=UPI002C2D724B|nr:hypothetical protein [Pseudomonas sp.]HWH86330.1 hypothetical protein [Pseudomonas sp.]